MENASDSKTLLKKVPGIIGTVLFFASFIPAVYAVYKGFTGVFFGLQGFAWFFGLPAILMTFAMQLFFLIPLVCLLYQFFFGRDYISKHKCLKIAALIVTGIVATSALISIVFAEKSLDIKYSMFQPKVRQYLTDRYGEEAYDNTTFEIASRYEMITNAYTPVLPKDKPYQIQIINDGKIFDTLVNEFVAANEDFLPSFRQYIIEKENIPAGMNVEPDIVSIDFRDYKYGDDFTVLFERTEYEIKEISVDLEKVTDDVVMDIAGEVWKDIYSDIPVCKTYTFSIMFTENGAKAVTVFFHNPKESTVTATFLVWSEWGGSSGLGDQKIELTR